MLFFLPMSIDISITYLLRYVCINATNGMVGDGWSIVLEKKKELNEIHSTPVARFNISIIRIHLHDIYMPK